MTVSLSGQCVAAMRRRSSSRVLWGTRPTVYGRIERSSVAWRESCAAATTALASEVVMAFARLEANTIWPIESAAIEPARKLRRVSDKEGVAQDRLSDRLSLSNGYGGFSRLMDRSLSRRRRVL